MVRKKVSGDKVVVSSLVDVGVCNQIDKFIGRLGQNRAQVIDFILTTVVVDLGVLDDWAKEVAAQQKV